MTALIRLGYVIKMIKIINLFLKIFDIAVKVDEAKGDYWFESLSEKAPLTLGYIGVRKGYDFVRYLCPNCLLYSIEEYFTEDGVMDCGNNYIDPYQPRLCHYCIIELSGGKNTQRCQRDDCKFWLSGVCVNNKECLFDIGSGVEDCYFEPKEEVSL